MSAIPRSLACGLIVSLGLTIMASVPSWAEPMALVGVGPRVGVGGSSPLGEEQKENFQMYDVAAHFRLPWDGGTGPLLGVLKRD